MKKIWLLLALIIGLGIGVFAYMQWQDAQKFTIMPRIFTISSSAPAEYSSAIGEPIERSIQQKLTAMSYNAAVPVYSESTSTVAIDVPKGITTDRMLEAFNQELNFALMREAPLDEADIVVNEVEGFANTGIVTNSIRWVDFAENDDGTGALRIELDEAGQIVLADLYQELDNQELGIFIRNQLVAKLLVQSDNFDKDIRIFNIPDLNLATLVADDLVVGRYVTFSQ